MTREYPLELENVGGDVYMLMSWGHHDFDTFMKAVKEAYPTWPMGAPTHEYFVKHPKKGWAAAPCDREHRRAIPATVTYEDYSVLEGAPK